MTVSAHPADPVTHPELVFGLVGPVGVDLHVVAHVLKAALLQVGYSSETVRLSKLMKELPGKPWADLPENGPYDKSLDVYMTAGNDFRQAVEKRDALSLLAVGAMREFRETTAGAPNKPLGQVAYLLHSLKRPEEVETLRRIYGPTFFLVSAYAPRDKRVQYLARRIAESKNLNQGAKFMAEAEILVSRDEEEAGQKYGQNVLDTFPLSDVIVNTEDPEALKASIIRFVELIFGHPFDTPSKDEQGMAQAYLAALRSASLARQVGASLCREDGSLAATGTNEVAANGGGSYWTDQPGDGRDFRGTRDTSDKMRENVLADILKRLQEAGWLASEKNDQSLGQLVQASLHQANGDKPPIMKGALFSRTIDYIRAVHAEMAALTDAARHGVSTKGCVLYTTTFPCHDCAKHIVASGIQRVVYVEPYPKSLVQEFYSDSITADSGSESTGKVRFDPFVGIAPKRYQELFASARKKRKLSDGAVVIWRPAESKPNLPDYLPSPLARLTAEREEFHAFQELLSKNGLVKAQ